MNRWHRIPEEMEKMGSKALVELALHKKRDTKMCMNMKEYACRVAGSWQVFCIIVSIYSRTRSQIGC